MEVELLLLCASGIVLIKFRNVCDFSIAPLQDKHETSLSEIYITQFTIVIYRICYKILGGYTTIRVCL